MHIFTSSGKISINKKTAYGKFVLGYTKTKAFSGTRTLEEAWSAAQAYKRYFNQISWHDTGLLTGVNYNRTGKILSPVITMHKDSLLTEQEKIDLGYTK